MIEQPDGTFALTDVGNKGKALQETVYDDNSVLGAAANDALFAAEQLGGKAYDRNTLINVGD
jgi:hypothetical protein